MDALPAELFGLVFDALSAPSMGHSACVSRRWLNAARQAARRRVQARPELAGRIYRRLRAQDGQHGPSFLSALGMVWLLEDTVGARPASHTWRDEFFGAVFDQTNPAGTPSPGALVRVCCKFPWALELREAQWPLDHADALPLLYTWANARISHAVENRSAGLAASVWAAGDALIAAAGRQHIHMGGASQPPLYANLSGRGGLMYDGDHVWERLTPHATAAVTFRTSAIVLAADGESCAAGIVWAGQPRASSAQAAGVVRFLPAAADASGLHALVDVGSGRYALPPLSLVSLLSVEPPGAWNFPWDREQQDQENEKQAEVNPTRCPLYTVRVTWV